MNTSCNNWFCWTLFTSVIFLPLAVGGGCKGHVDAELHEPKLRLVAVLYSQYLAAHDGQAPRDDEEFREYVQSLGPGVLRRAGLSGLDDLFMSTRDGRPFAIKCLNEEWPLDGIIAYEQAGAIGTRFVAAELGRVSEITEADFQTRLNDRK